MASALLGGCAAFAPPVAMPEKTAPPLDAPPAWSAPAPPAAAQAPLRDWWTQFDDPVLLEMIEAAQAASPTIAAAGSRIEQARASSVAAGALLLPAVNANASGTAGRTDLATPRLSFASVNLQASWELDLFGANQAGRDAALARLARHDGLLGRRAHRRRRRDGRQLQRAARLRSRGGADRGRCALAH